MTQFHTSLIQPSVGFMTYKSSFIVTPNKCLLCGEFKVPSLTCRGNMPWHGPFITNHHKTFPALKWRHRVCLWRDMQCLHSNIRYVLCYFLLARDVCFNLFLQLCACYYQLSVFALLCSILRGFPHLEHKRSGEGVVLFPHQPGDTLAESQTHYFNCFVLGGHCRSLDKNQHVRKQKHTYMIYLLFFTRSFLQYLCCVHLNVWVSMPGWCL